MPMNMTSIAESFFLHLLFLCVGFGKSKTCDSGQHNINKKKDWVHLTETDKEPSGHLSGRVFCMRVCERQTD